MITIKKPIKEYISEISKDLEITEDVVRKFTKDFKEFNDKYLHIPPKECIRCALCYEECPVDAITKPTVRKSAEIIQDECVKCEICAMTCPVGIIDLLYCRSYLDDNKDVVFEISEKEVMHRTLKLIKYDIDINNCIKCGICAKYCPTNAITVVRRKSFDIDLNKCVGCRACENVCPKKVIKVKNELGEVEFNKKISVDNDACVKCLLCIEECPINIIKEIDEGIEINKPNCIFCGRCESVCPVSAITIEELNSKTENNWEVKVNKA